MRPVRNKQTIAFERCFKLSHLKPIIRQRAREDRQSLHRSRNLSLEITCDPDEVLFKTLPLRRLVLVRLASLVQLFAHEREKCVLAVLVGASIEIQADYWRGRRFEVQ